MTNNNNNQFNQNSSKGEVTIVAIHVEGSDISKYKLSDGRIIGEQDAVQLVESGELSGCTLGNRNGISYVRAYPDVDTSNNLASLPRF